MDSTDTFHIRYLASVDETASLAQAIASVIEVGDVLLLNGGIGSGKTTFARAFAEALGVVEPITSPSFVIQAVYESGRLPVSHVDLYRLDEDHEVESLGVDEYFESAVTLIEWADRYGHFAEPFLVVRFDLGPREDDRIATLTPHGGTWADRLVLALPEPA